LCLKQGFFYLSLDPIKCYRILLSAHIVFNFPVSAFRLIELFVTAISSSA
jgi:hypothetical protein